MTTDGDKLWAEISLAPTHVPPTPPFAEHKQIHRLGLEDSTLPHNKPVSSF